MTRELIIQLARLGDLVQTLPAITALKARNPVSTLDLLCPSQLAPIARLFPGIARVLEWDGPGWRQRAETASPHLRPDHLAEAERSLRALSAEPYERAYVLNQHARALLAGALLARDCTGPRRHGPLDEQLTPWAAYVREVAQTGRGRRVHLADAFCGLCGVSPPGPLSPLTPPSVTWPEDLEAIGHEGGPWIGLIVGAGETERLVPIEVWQRWILRFFACAPRGRVVLVGQEGERAGHIQETLPPSVLGRIWDATGRTSLPQLAAILGRCRRVIGADTGPLHLAAAVGTPVIGWYFARARVHETGPYGRHHLVWQAEGANDRPSGEPRHVQPAQWPIEDTLGAVLNRQEPAAPDGWSVWRSQCDRLGAYYTEPGDAPVAPSEREDLWRTLQPARG